MAQGYRNSPHSDRPFSSRTSNSSHINRLISQRQPSDARAPTTCFLIFENSNCNSWEIRFLEYRGTRTGKHRSYKLYIPQLTRSRQRAADDTYDGFADSVREVLYGIPAQDLASYTISVRTGVTYFFSKAFNFRQRYRIDQLWELIQKKIPVTDERYYFQRAFPTEEFLRSTFSNVKPISQTREFVGELQKQKFFVKEPKHVYRVYLQSEDKQTHVCTIDPAANYAIIEFSKDFQRNSNIDVIRDRSQSQFCDAKTYDDVFDFRVQFQYNPRTGSDQMDAIVDELRQQFPQLDERFQNEYILRPNENSEHELIISEQLYPYIRYIRRDFGDIYEYRGDDELFENYTIYLESSVEYSIERTSPVCRRSQDTHGLVYARLDLQTMLSANEIADEALLIEKLWDMGTGLTELAGQCTTAETQQATNFYPPNGGVYTAEDEVLVQNVLRQSTLHSMLRLPYYAAPNEIKAEYERIDEQLKTKWNCISRGTMAREKLNNFYQQFITDQK